MYDVLFYDRLTRQRLSAGGRYESLPCAKHLPSGVLAEARNVQDPRGEAHWDGKEWRDGPLPGRKPHKDAAPGAW